MNAKESYLGVRCPKCGGQKFPGTDQCRRCYSGTAKGGRPVTPVDERLIISSLDPVKPRVVEVGDIDRKERLRPLLLFKGNITEGRVRAMTGAVVSMMDLNIGCVTNAVKLSRQNPDFTHIFGLHATPTNSAFNSILGRLIVQPSVTDLIPGLREYVRHLAHSSGARVFCLDPIPAQVLRVRSHRTWRLIPGHLRPRKERTAALELYPYISGQATAEHDLLMAVDRLVPKGLPNDVRCDVCQDMVLSILMGETTVEDIKGETSKHLKRFWKMFPSKYGNISLDQAVRGTDHMPWNDKLDARTSRLV